MYNVLLTPLGLTAVWHLRHWNREGLDVQMGLHMTVQALLADGRKESTTY